MHVSACCVRCPNCKFNIKYSYYTSHRSRCKSSHPGVGDPAFETQVTYVGAPVYDADGFPVGNLPIKTEDSFDSTEGDAAG